MLLSSSNRTYPPFPLLSYFSVVVCLRCLLHRILSLIAYTFQENREFVFIIILFMMSANIRIHFGLQIALVCLYCTPFHYHHCANLSVGIELIKCLSDIFCWVCKIEHILSVIHYTICVAVCFQFTHFSCNYWDNIYLLCLIVIIKSEVWTITPCLGLGHETIVSVVCLSLFFWKRSDNIRQKWRHNRCLCDVTLPQPWRGGRLMRVFIYLSVFQHPKIM